MLRRPQVQEKVTAFNQLTESLRLTDFGFGHNILNHNAAESVVTEDPNKLAAQGVRAHPSLIEYITSNYYDRVMKIVIKDGYFCLAFCLGADKSWEEDYDDMVLELLDDDESCYIIYRLDEARGRHFEHVFITWQPEDASVADRATYTTSKSNLIELYEDGTFTYHLAGANECDVDFNALKYVMMSEGEIEPLSKYEELKREALAEEEVARSRQMKKIPDIDMQVDDDAIKEINKFVKGFINFVQFGIDNKKEIIRCSDSRNVTVNELPDKMPEATPRFNLFRYSHVKEGKYTEFVPVFIYYIPEEGSAKSKSLYPCAIDGFIKKLQGYGADIKLRLEFSDLHDMTEGVLYELIYPPDRSELEKSFREIAPTKRAGKRGGWVKVLPV
ncbi:hypothetical protein ACHWQZ_G004709 [Mnemiopsis leidyi]